MYSLVFQAFLSVKQSLFLVMTLPQLSNVIGDMACSQMSESKQKRLWATRFS